MKWDYLIVGQGLAGSILSYTLIEKGLKVLVFDDPRTPKASLVAAGIFNPFTGRKMVKTWMLDLLFPFLLDFYKRLETQLKVKFLHAIPMYRPFLSPREQNQWGARVHDPGYGKYINQVVPASKHFPEIDNPMGGLMLRNCGYVNTSSLIQSIKYYLVAHNALIQDRFDYDSLQIAKDQVAYLQQTARKVIFCEGPGLIQNPYFNWLPLNPVKGEMLEIELENSLKYIYNRGIFILPTAENICLVGATFDHQHLNWEVSTAGRNYLINKLDNAIKRPYQVIGQTAGIRPASKDRRPLIGLHPSYEPLGVFNGLGTKGISLAPYLAQEFSGFLESEKPLLNEVTISRYFSLYYNKI